MCPVLGIGENLESFEGVGDAVIDDLAAVVVGALTAAGYPVGDPVPPEELQTGDVQMTVRGVW